MGERTQSAPVRRDMLFKIKPDLIRMNPRFFGCSLKPFVFLFR
jgi:hypothetical protein